MRIIALLLLVVFVVTLVGCNIVCNADRCNCSRDTQIKKFGEEKVQAAEARKAARGGMNAPAEMPVKDGK